MNYEVFLLNPSFFLFSLQKNYFLKGAFRMSRANLFEICAFPSTSHSVSSVNGTARHGTARGLASVLALDCTIKSTPPTHPTPPTWSSRRTPRVRFLRTSSLLEIYSLVLLFTAYPLSSSSCRSEVAVVTQQIGCFWGGSGSYFVTE